MPINDDRFTGRYSRPVDWTKEDDRKIRRKNKLRVPNPAALLAGLPAGFTIEYDSKSTRISILFGKQLMFTITESELAAYSG